MDAPQHETEATTRQSPTPPGNDGLVLVSEDPLASTGSQFALTGSCSSRYPADAPSQHGVRPWGLRRAERAAGTVWLPSWRYDHQRQVAVTLDGDPLIDSPVAGKPTAQTTASKDGEDPPSSEDWIND